MKTETLTIPSMPALWHMENFCVSHKAVSSALAHWAVFQSPYTTPDNLGAAVAQFMEMWPHGDYMPMSSAELEMSVRETIAHCPLILAWNAPKLEGATNEHGHAFVPRFDSIKPDYDFIDLGALARNITHEVVLWAQVERAQDEQRSVTSELTDGAHPARA